MSFSKKIDMLMSENNIKNLRQLANEVDIPYTTLWDYYSNPIRFEKANLTYIKRIAKYLNCTVDYLAYEEITNHNQIKLDEVDSIEKKNSLDELDTLYYECRHLLNDDDKETIKFIIEKRKKEKELKEE